MNIALIPARGGSKRIPGKNIKLFAGKPLIAYSIAAARACGLFDRIIVSTDSPAIAEVATGLGAEAPFLRPADLADDFASTDSVFLHTLSWLDKESRVPDYACCIYASAPLLQPEALLRGLALLKEQQATSAFSVTTFPSPVFRALRLDERQRLSMVWPEHHGSRSQDLPEVYHDAGQFYWVDVVKYLSEGRVFSSDAVPVRIPRHLVQDIDTPEDWTRAELMFRCLTPGAG
jgi:pseudaminic acid cytidylyltransferase